MNCSSHICSSKPSPRPAADTATPHVSKKHHPQQPTAAVMANAGEGVGAGGKKVGMPTWVPPPALGEGGLTEMLDRMYPLKVFNSLTRTKVSTQAG